MAALNFSHMTIDGLYYGVCDFMVTLLAQIEQLNAFFEDLRKRHELPVAFAQDVQLLEVFRGKVVARVDPLRQSFADWVSLTAEQQQHCDNEMRQALQNLYAELTEIQLGLGPMQSRLERMT